MKRPRTVVLTMRSQGQGNPRGPEVLSPPRFRVPLLARHLHEPPPVVVVIVVGPVEVRVAVLVDVREVAVAVGVLPRRRVSGIIFATILLYTIGVELFDLDRLGF